MRFETTVHTDEYTLGEDGETMTVSDEAIVVGSSEDTARIPREAIKDVYLDIDQGLSGFKMVGNGFGFIGLLMAVLFVGAIQDGFTVSVESLGTMFSSILGFLGFVYYRRLDDGDLDILVVETTEETHRFINTDARDEFEQIKRHL